LTLCRRDVKRHFKFSNRITRIHRSLLEIHLHGSQLNQMGELPPLPQEFNRFQIGFSRRVRVMRSLRWRFLQDFALPPLRRPEAMESTRSMTAPRRKVL
jgi:hypothetical protein